MRFPTFAAAAAVALALAPAAHATGFGSNLIANGNAETGNTTGWNTTSAFTVVQYGASGGFPFPADPGPSDRGTYFFAGGDSNAKSTATQTIDLSSLSAAINTGASRYDLSAWLGGYSSQNDNAKLTATFFGSGGAVLSSASLGPVSNSERGNQTGLLLRDTQGYIPVGALNVGITLTMTREAGSYNDGYADNLSFAVAAAPVPEADAYAMLLGGLALLGVVAKRKQRKVQA
ncbi:hypothetical protein D0T25_09725 [Duganella sp. BJB488]|uniref:PEP-CTERM sorting domain-containing protein n=1 Tax=unclassified Duganella TaxID=2636909 RepID=UPI000E347B25|nr:MULTISPECIES: PEP-CTERM sorting domain-containing protein [unclassified Duganella]RFP21532.1 hypothetical protein D0T26_09765 [Duganella sp. BJB489]RFP23325.1 hypothetical protein D0T25_09725 [Duganella sp. BJB488]RFP38491.1 hypothetical protein D0T24_02570 [Duganella sp. BJB480]